MADKLCRLRKYGRRKRRARTPEVFDRLARLYWRYHWQVYGPHVNLWRSGMDRAGEMRDLRRTMREQEAWGKFSGRNANRLAELERQERVERWGFDPLCLAVWSFALAYCLLFWLAVGVQLWGLAKSLIGGIMSTVTGG